MANRRPVHSSIIGNSSAASSTQTFSRMNRKPPFLKTARNRRKGADLAGSRWFQERRRPSKQRTGDATKAGCDIELTALFAAIVPAYSRW
jgi:hypothetical protein